MVIAFALGCSDYRLEHPGRWEGHRSLAEATWIFEGAAATQCAGMTLAAAGDVDGDGLADLLIGGPCDDRNGPFTHVGSAWLVRGGVAPGRQSLVSAASLGVHGTDDYHRAGHGLAGIGDVDGDGLDDIAVGYPSFTIGAQGAVATLKGDRTGNPDVLFTDGRLLGPTDAAAGTGLYFGDDVTGDERSDLVVVGYETVWIVSDYDHAYLDLSTDAAATISGFTSTTTPDASTAVSDLDGDGRNELVVTSATPDEARVFAAPIAGAIDVSDAASRLAAPAGPGGNLQVSAGGDAEGDGLPDLAFGLPNIDGSNGGAWLVPAPPPGDSDLAAVATVAFLPGPDDLVFGSDVRWVGDLDGDGADDLAISAFRDSEGGLNAGATWLFYGPFLGDVELASVDAAKFLGESEEDTASGVVAVGDMDGDGVTELAFGAEHRDIGGRSGGAVYVFPGAP